MTWDGGSLGFREDTFGSSSKGPPSPMGTSAQSSPEVIFVGFGSTAPCDASGGLCSRGGVDADVLQCRKATARSLLLRVVDFYWVSI